MKKSSIIHPNVSLGKNCQIHDLVILGYGGKKKVTIGENALIRSHTVIYHGNKIGKNFKTGNGVNIRENNKIGNNVSIGTHSIIEHNVVIEDNVRIHSNAFVPELTILKKECWIGPNVVFTNAHLPLCKNRPKCFKGVVIGEKARICAGAIVLPGIKVGKNSVVGAGSVVTKNVPAGMVVAGNPAQTIKKTTQLTCPVNS
jgi:acetyltransferase-like isoleucine patch superfamily enzyme